MAELTGIERETVILWNQAEKTATISTMDPALIRKMTILSQNDTAITVREERPGYAEYICPKKYIKVRGTRQLSSEKKQLLSERAKAMAERRRQNAENGNS
jgi:hypothetical protein